MYWLSSQGTAWLWSNLPFDMGKIGKVITMENKTAVIFSMSNHRFKIMQTAVPANEPYIIQV